MMIKQTKVTFLLNLITFKSRTILIFIFFFSVAAKELELKLKQLKMANQKLARNSRDSVFDQNMTMNSTNHGAVENSAESANVEETSLFKKIEIEIGEMASSSVSLCAPKILLAVILLIAFKHL